MELRHLRYFIAVAEELHFAKAASRLHIAPPSLSKQIQLLEQELGFPLFYRTQQKVELLENGIKPRIAQVARQVLAVASLVAGGLGVALVPRFPLQFASPRTDLSTD